ncbi:MAG: hypothetical protein KAU14_08035 [Thermoplasmata archaeon]|nr:hypothetical protein [Thermoplasmata archaeon]
MHKIRLIANILIVSILLTIIVVTAEGDDDDNDDWYYGDATVVSESWSKDNYTREGESTEVDHLFEGRVNSTIFNLTWTDNDTTEANVGGLGVQNQPDRFRLTIVSPNGTEYSEEAESDISSEDGVILIEIYLGMTEEEQKKGKIKDFEAGDWGITIECVDAGDSETTLGQVITQDNGNEWTLLATYTYFKEVNE